MANANTAGGISRIGKEIAHIQRETDLSLAVACRDSDIRHVRALIVGPPGTPYEFGFFEFEVRFGKNYPLEAPGVRCITTNNGQTRFNPNIYAQGKVCLSILGTWRGEPGEEWSCAQGLESVLVSIQSLLSSNPYENEPGFEGFTIGDLQAATYARKIRHETLRISVLQRLEQILKPPGTDVDPLPGAAQNGGHNGLYAHSNDESPPPAAYEYDAEATYNALDPTPWDPFTDLLKRRFLWYYDSYMQTIESARNEQKDGTQFKLTRFECSSNGMQGRYDYEALRRRMDKLRQTLSDERRAWVAAGAKQVAEGSQLATQLTFQFDQLRFKWNEGTYDSSRLEISLPDKENPFAWHLTMFGKPMTNLDGGVFNISMTVPPDFPDSWPRVYVDTPLYHHRVSSNGILCYFPQKPEELASHISAIVAAIEDEKPNYDPRTPVNPEAAALFWGGDDKRKMYNRKLRRSAQDSSEF